MTQCFLSVSSIPETIWLRWCGPSQGEGSGKRRAAQTTTVIMKTKCLLAAKPHPGCCERVLKAGLRNSQLSCYSAGHTDRLEDTCFSNSTDTSREVWKRFEVCLLLNTMRSVMLLKESSGNVFFLQGENKEKREIQVWLGKGLVLTFVSLCLCTWLMKC